MDLNGFDFLLKPIHIKPIAGGTQDAYMELPHAGCLNFYSELPGGRAGMEGLSPPWPGPVRGPGPRPRFGPQAQAHGRGNPSILLLPPLMNFNGFQ